MAIASNSLTGVEQGRNSGRVVEALLRLASGARFFRSADGRLHGAVPVDDRREIYGLKSASFRDWLIERYRSEGGQPPQADVVRRVLTSLEARARFDRSTPAVHVRVGRDSERGRGDFYIDLGDASGKAVKINAEGWLVVDQSPVHFWRPDGQLPLPAPSRGGSIEGLRPYVNLAERDFRLLVGWMAAALLPEGPYPILAVHGEQGSAKSTLAKVVRLLVDPQAAPVLTLPRSTRDLMATAIGGWLLVYDNISVLPNWLSDGLCLLATGGGFAARALHSNDERSVIHAERAVILNGIDEFVRREDLADRCVFLELPAIGASSRRAQVEFWQSFRADQAAIFGGLLDAIVGGLSALSSVSFSNLPRMADFARFGEAVGRGLGWGEETFFSVYGENRREAAKASLEESPLAEILLESASFGGRREWTRSSSDLLADLSQSASRAVRASARWPKTPRALSNELRRIAPQLRMHGVSVTFSRTRESRLITINANASTDYSTVTH